MGTVVYITNPFDPLKDAKRFDIGHNQTIYGWLRKQYPGFKEFERPTLCLLNGEPIKRWRWKRITPKESDIVTFVPVPADPYTLLYVFIAAVVVAAVVVATMPKLQTPNAGPEAAADPVYTLRGQRNQVRLGMPIESAYGAPRMWPSYAAASYNQYRDNQQWLYQLFSLGHGEFDITEKRFEDTNVEDFQDIEIEICPPGTPVTLMPISVVTSSEVAAIELLGPNEPGGGSWVVDSEGDPDADPPIEETGHYNAAMAGPFVANPANSEANTIECDLVFPRGLYKQNDDGSMVSLTVTVLFEMRLINNAGSPIGSWETMESVTKTLSTITPQRFTITRVVPFGRYQVRASRTTNKDTSNRAGNVVQWEAMRAFLNAEQAFGDVTLIAVKARATNNLNDNSAQRFNVLATRKLPIWNSGTQTWSALTATRNPIWAFCDIFRSLYGAKLTDAYLDLDYLATLAAQATTNGWTFDWVFDQKITCWEAARLVAQSMRSVPMLNGSRVTAVYDEPKTVPTSIFNQANIVKGSFRWEIKLWEENPFDGVRVTYVDPTTWKEETVLCTLPGEAGDNPEEVTLQGVTDRDQAYELGMYRRAIQRYVRENFVFSTGLEGNIPTYGDLIAIGHDIPLAGKSGRIKMATGANIVGTPTMRTLTLDEPVTFDGVSTYKVLVRRNDGTTLGPFTATPGANPKEITLVTSAEYWDDLDFTGDKLLPLFIFGKSTEVGRYARVVNLAPSSDDTVEITAVNYDDRVFDPAGTTPVLETPPEMPAMPANPWVSGLIANRVPNSVNEIMAQWFPSRGAKYYVIQISYDSLTWETINDNFADTNIRFSVQPGTVYVRVAAVNVGQGPWAYWVGAAPVDGTNVVIGNGNTPGATSAESFVGGFGSIWGTWVNPTNVRIKNIHVYMNTTSTQPGSPSFSLPPDQTWLLVDGLADNATRYFWIKVESVDGLFSSVRGPFSATTPNGITLDHLIPGGLQPVEIVTALPATGNYQGRVVFLTADDAGTTPTSAKDKLYRWTSPSVTTGKLYWTAAVPTVDLTGQIVSGQIADAAILNAKLADAAISTAKLQDALITTAKLVNDAVTDVKVATGAITTTKITDSAITTAKLNAGAVTAAKITAGTITANEIAANTITAAKIQAGTITATEIAANTITAAKIFAGTITATEIAANTITAAKIFAGTITATEIATNAITTAKIDADAVTAGKIQAGAITATAVGTNEIIANTANIKDGVITSAKIVSLVADKIAAGTISAAISITSPTINGGTITGASLIINTGLGLRYSTDTGVYTITGGSGNGIQHGPQIDLQGTDFGGTDSGGAMVLQAGDGALGFIEFRTNYGGNTGGADYGLVRMTIARAGDVTVNNQCNAASFNATSARRYKKKIRNITNALATVQKLQGKTFTWKTRKNFNKRGRDFGLIAEEVQKILPSCVYKNSKTKRVEGMEYGKLVAYLIEAVKELTVRVEEMEGANA